MVSAPLDVSDDDARFEAEARAQDERRADDSRKATLKLAAMIRAAETETHNIEAEQALLGIVLYENAAIHTLPTGFEAWMFYEPFHQRLFSTMKEEIDAGLLTEPILLGEQFRRDPAYIEMGGIRYLADLVDRAPPAANAPDYARVIADLGTRRKIVATALDMIVEAGSNFDKSGAEIIETTEADLMTISARSTTYDLVSLKDAMAGTMAYIDDRSKVVGVYTGLTPIDNILGPILPKDLIVMGGATGMGKSLVAEAICQNVAAPDLAALFNDHKHDPMQHRRGVIALHGEMTWGDAEGSGQAARRHMTDVGYHLFGKKFPTYAAIRAKKVSVEQRAMMEEVASFVGDIPIVGLKKQGLTPARVRSIVRRQLIVWERQGIEPGLIAIDHGGLMHPDERTPSRYEAQTRVVLGLKDLADELNIPILLLVQISRGVTKLDDKRPTPSDLKDSGEYENSADAAILLYRDAYYAKREREPDVAKKPLDWAEWDRRIRSKEIEAIMGKVREGEGGGTAKIWADIGWNAVRGMEPQGTDGGFL